MFGIGGFGFSKFGVREFEVSGLRAYEFRV